MKLRAALLLALAVAACKGGVAHGGAGVGEACGADADCARPLSCASGECALPPDLRGCAPGTRRCQGSDVVQCDAAGVSESLVESCPQSCRDGACAAEVCSPGARRCGNGGVEQCLPGPGWALVEACPAGCDGAACKPLACKPLETRCAPDLQVCAADGTRWTDQPCGAGAACSSGQCVAQRCAPGSVFCDGSVLVKCDASGSGFAQQTPCAIGCANGACVAPVCSPGASRCSADGSAVESCRPDGSGWSLSQQCPAAGCVALAADRASCAAPVCAPLTRRRSAAGDAG